MKKLLTSLTPSGLAMGAIVPGMGRLGVAPEPLPIVPTMCGAVNERGGVPIRPGPHDSIIVGEPHVKGLEKKEIVTFFYTKKTKNLISPAP